MLQITDRTLFTTLRAKFDFPVDAYEEGEAEAEARRSVPFTPFMHEVIAKIRQGPTCSDGDGSD